MSTEKINHWVNSISRLPEFATIRTPVAKIEWLNRHMQEYLDRWLGFATNKEIAVRATINNDVFAVLFAATLLLEQLIQDQSQLGSFPFSEWNLFRTSIRAVQESPSLENVVHVQTAFENYFENWAGSKSLPRA